MRDPKIMWLNSYNYQRNPYLSKEKLTNIYQEMNPFIYSPFFILKCIIYNIWCYKYNNEDDDDINR